MVGLQLLQHGEAVDRRHLQVENDHVGSLLAREPQAFVAAARLEELVARFVGDDLAHPAGIGERQWQRRGDVDVELLVLVADPRHHQLGHFARGFADVDRTAVDLDAVGLDVSLAIQRQLYLEFREPGFAPAPLLEQLVTAGYLGRKAGRGFRTYT